MAKIKIDSLHHKLVLTVFIAMLLLSCVTAVFAYLYQFKQSQHETELTLNQLLDTVSLTASIAAYSKNEQIAKDVLKGLLKNSVVQRAYISSDHGFFLSQEKLPLPIGTSVHRELISPFNDGEVIGKISLHASTNYNLEKAQQSAIFSIIISISLIGLTALIILLQVKRGVSSPLAYVSNTLHAIGTAKVKRISLLKQHENDELGRLCNDINSLLETLQTQFDAERSLREQIEVTEQQLRHIYNSSSAGLFVLNEQGYLLNYNSTFTAILNGPEELTKDATTEGLFESLLNQQSSFTLLVKQALSSANLETQDFAIVGEDNRSTPRWIHCLLSKLIDASGNVVLEGVIFDVTERVHKEQLIKRVAHYDELTGMLRRQPAKTQFESYIASNPSLNVGFVMMDLDGFKQINDSYGHLAGDQVLSIVAERLFKCVRTSDIVCRLGGDEFLIIIMNDNDVNLKQDIASKLLNRISQPISLEGDELVSVGVSIGITDLQLSNTKNFDKLIKDADKVMYQVKKNGKSNYQVKAQCLSKTATS